MKIYEVKNSDYTLIIDYLESKHQIAGVQKKFVYNVLKYLYKNNNKFNDTFTLYSLNKELVLIESYIIDFVNLYDVTINELIENNILIVVLFNTKEGDQ